MSETLPSGNDQSVETFPQPQDAPEAYDKLLDAIMDAQPSDDSQSE